MFCCCPQLLCCYAMGKKRGERGNEKANREAAYTQTKGGFQPFVPTIKKTSPSQADEYAAPIRPPPRRKN